MKKAFEELCSGTGNREHQGSGSEDACTRNSASLIPELMSEELEWWRLSLGEPAQPPSAQETHLKLPELLGRLTFQICQIINVCCFRLLSVCLNDHCCLHPMLDPRTVLRKDLRTTQATWRLILVSISEGNTEVKCFQRLPTRFGSWPLPPPSKSAVEWVSAQKEFSTRLPREENIPP
ncbi:uncharacterized protein LOC115280643 isoform X4 [Suricata suricatta]|uniref:uncharacterized protein LOC115280643 isoform X4 n=1 Tax=Suricata suricatta TaxID=37032 RepID=UPI001155F2E7|nr:uncharacterized protein LOC115280643 isoform X4 [Suricata suricatta]